METRIELSVCSVKYFNITFLEASIPFRNDYWELVDRGDRPQVVYGRQPLLSNQTIQLGSVGDGIHEAKVAVLHEQSAMFVTIPGFFIR